MIYFAALFKYIYFRNWRNTSLHNERLTHTPHTQRKGMGNRMFQQEFWISLYQTVFHPCTCARTPPSHIGRRLMIKAECTMFIWTVSLWLFHSPTPARQHAVHVLFSWLHQHWKNWIGLGSKIYLWNKHYFLVLLLNNRTSLYWAYWWQY